MSPKIYSPDERWEILLEALGSASGPEEVCLRRGITLVELRRWLFQAREGALARLREGCGEGRTNGCGAANGNGSYASSNGQPSNGYLGSSGTRISGIFPNPLANQGSAPPPATWPAPPGYGPGSSAAASLTPPPTSAPVVSPAPLSSPAAPPLATEFSGEDIDGMFSMVAHELKEPIRGVKAVCQLLEEDCLPSLPEPGRGYLETLHGLSARMQSTVDGLSEYARAGRNLLPFQPVPLASVMEQVRAQLGTQLSSRQGTVLVDPRLPTVMGDPLALAQVFRHLMLNGLKFCTGLPRVDVISGGVDPATGLATVVVRDNGIGIETRYQRKIFELFQRLHRREEYPGVGVGLATVRKIIQVHRGRIEVESEPGQGSRFLVRLPLAPASN